VASLRSASVKPLALRHWRSGWFVMPANLTHGEIHRK
jgi:hypothetical protein